MSCILTLALFSRLALNSAKVPEEHSSEMYWEREEGGGVREGGRKVREMSGGGERGRKGKGEGGRMRKMSEGGVREGWKR